MDAKKLAGRLARGSLFASRDHEPERGVNAEFACSVAMIEEEVLPFIEAFVAMHAALGLARDHWGSNAARNAIEAAFAKAEDAL